MIPFSLFALLSLPACQDQLILTYDNWVQESCPLTSSELYHEYGTLQEATEAALGLCTPLITNYEHSGFYGIPNLSEHRLDSAVEAHLNLSVTRTGDTQRIFLTLDESQLDDPLSLVPEPLDGGAPASGIDFVACDQILERTPVQINGAILLPDSTIPVAGMGDLVVFEAPDGQAWRASIYMNDNETRLLSVEYYVSQEKDQWDIRALEFDELQFIADSPWEPAEPTNTTDEL